MTLEEVTREAVYLVDNCQIYGEASRDSDTMSMDSKTSSKNQSATNSIPQQVSLEQITENVIRNLNQNLRLQNQRMPPLRRCMTCGGDHPTQMCPSLPQQPLRQKWCAIEGKLGNHITEECYYNKGQVRERHYHLILNTSRDIL